MSQFGSQPVPSGGRKLSPRELWRRALTHLEDTLPRDTYQTWFAATEAVEFRNRKLIVNARDAFKREVLQHQQYPSVSVAVEQAAGARYEVEFVVLSGSAQPDPEPEPEAAERADSGGQGGNGGNGGNGGLVDRLGAGRTEQGFVSAATPSRFDSAANGGRSDRSDHSDQAAPRLRPSLVPSFTFENFVVGTSNQIAHATAQRVAEVPGRAHNPLFIYARSGLGKTHLLQAMAHRTVGSYETVCIEIESFIREFVAAVREGSRAQFQERYERSEVLLVDDIQALADREGTQDEFFNLFNTLHQSNRQIVICSDVHPRQLRGLPERLVTRFEGGLVVEIEPPDLELRQAILSWKSRQSGLDIDETALSIIAQRARRNVRELEGALHQVRAFAEVEGAPLDRETVLRALERMKFEEPVRSKPTVPEIITAASEVTGVSIDHFSTPNKDAVAVRARYVAMYLVREVLGLSYTTIGAHFGGRDHTTVMHGCRKIRRETQGGKGKPPNAETVRIVAETKARLRL